MKLSGEQVERLKAVLPYIYPDEASPRQMVHDVLNRNLEEVARVGSVSGSVSDLVDWAIKIDQSQPKEEDRTAVQKLILAASLQNPDRILELASQVAEENNQEELLY